MSEEKGRIVEEKGSLKVTSASSEKLVESLEEVDRFIECSIGTERDSPVMLLVIFASI